MIIKYYAYSKDSPVSDLFIIDGAEDVIVHGSLFASDEHGPEIQTVQNHYFYDNDQEIQAEKPYKKLITFNRHGMRCRLGVYGTAYVCNNDGETIQKVSPAA